MAKKKKAGQAAKAAEPVESAPSQVAPPKVEAPAEELQDLQDIARRLVPGYQEHWWPSLKAHAAAMGVVLPASLETCKAVLRHWGAKL
jgi:hypothetical protein